MRPIKNFFRNILFGHFLWPHLLRRVQLPYIRKYLQISKGDLLLDIGCGTGGMTSRIKGAQLVIGIDSSPLVLELKPKEKIKWIQGDGKNLPFADRTVDKILLSSVLQMTPDYEDLLREALRVLKPDGKIVATVPTGLVFTPKIYGKGWLRYLIRKILRLPKTYNDLIEEMRRKHGGTGPGQFSPSEVVAVVQRTGALVLNWEYCPRALGSICYEFIVLIKRSLGQNISAYGYFPLSLFIIAWFDRFLSSHSKGCEIIFSVIKRGSTLDSTNLSFKQDFEL
ncbi:MAG: methylase involved in ubiquinone/menaquinone biosynthesis [Bacteriovoracaceae bacterium]|nr:methylase involved in ubiquinone/menaquinone biosynthesis [Bacteriovoracaceae bacterium]